MRTVTGTVFLVTIGVAVYLSAQDPAFDVASIKVRDTTAAGPTGVSPRGEIWIDGGSLRTIVPFAFDVPIPVQNLKVVWSPAAAKLARTPLFEIQAKGNPSNDTRAMLRTLLRERFGLRTHTEVRQVPIFALTVKQSGKLGPWLTPSTYNCNAFRARGGGPTDADVPMRGDVNVCWNTRSPKQPERGGERVHVGAGTINDLIESVALPGVLGERPVIDMTGLSGNFLWEFAGRDRHAIEGTIFFEFESQLGLMLEPRTGPWEVLVIDDVRLPTPN